MFGLKRLTVYYVIFTTTEGEKKKIAALLQPEKLYRIITGQYFTDFWHPGCIGMAA